MKLWITASVAAAWVAVFSAWVISQEGPAGGSAPAENGQASRTNQSEDTPRPTDRSAWRPRERRPEGFAPSRRGVFGLGMVLLATLDTNTDAVLSEKEIDEAREALLALDEDGDGEVSRHEFYKAMPQVMEKMHGRPMGFQKSGGFHGPGRFRHRESPGGQPPMEEAQHGSRSDYDPTAAQKSGSEKRRVTIRWYA